MRKWAGNNAYEQVWRPLLKGKFGTRHEDISMAWLWGKIHLRTTSRSSINKEVLGYPTGSFKIIVDALEKAIRDMGGHIHLGASIEKIEARTSPSGELTAVGIRTGEGLQEFEKNNIHYSVQQIPRHFPSRRESIRREIEIRTISRRPRDADDLTQQAIGLLLAQHR